MKRGNFSSGQKYWERTIAKQRESGLTAKEFCHRQGIVLSSFYSHSRKGRPQGEIGGVKDNLIPIEVRQDFVKASIRLRLASGVGVELEGLPSIELSPEISLIYFKKAVSVAIMNLFSTHTKSC